MIETLEDFKTETRAWLEENCPMSMRKPVKSGEEIYWGGRNAKFDSQDQQIWFERMADKGWTAPTWPKEYGGGGLSKEEARILQAEMARINARSPLYSFGLWMLGPALLKYGSEEQKLEHLPQIAQGKIWWCQGYSEPGAGSDLAGLQTRAELQGNHYVVNGSKIWTSYADKADMIFCLVRTNPEAPKHSGISFLLIDMASEGVSTSPIKLISGKSPFCQTFFDNVKVPAYNLVGEENAGWTIAKYLLQHERDMIGSLYVTEGQKPLSKMVNEILGENIQDDPALALKIAQHEMDMMAFKLTIGRGMDEMKQGQNLGAKSSMLKYVGTELNKDRYELMVAINGFDGLGWEGEEFNEGKIVRDYLRTKANSIEGGTSEIQLNIISKHILGLP